MNLYNLVFSNQRSVRIRRHLLFWAAWTIYLAVTYLIPTHWIPAWDFKGPTPHVDSYGYFWATVRIISASIMLAVVHAALVYGILYYFLPRYLDKNKNWIVTTVLLLAYISVIALINYFNFLLSFYLSTRAKYFTSMPGMSFTILRWGRQILFNYPTIVGFALAIKLMKNWYLKQQEAAEAARENINAELQLLKAQVHPHFLFNTLNNIYSFIINNSPTAPEALNKLSALLHYLVYECDQSQVQLEKELKMIRDYIDLEKIRYGENFNMSLHIMGNAENKMICPLLLVPFLENSFKHGTSQMLTHPWINLKIIVEEKLLLFNLSNNKPSISTDNGISKGLGLNNVKKRLAILYPGSHSLTIQEDLMSFNIALKIPLSSPGDLKEQVSLEKESYELA